MRKDLSLGNRLFALKMKIFHSDKNENAPKPQGGKKIKYIYRKKKNNVREIRQSFIERE